MKFDPKRFDAVLRIQQKAQADARKIHDDMKRELAKLDTPEAKKQFTGSFLFDRKVEIRSTARLAVMKIREQAEKDIQPALQFARELENDFILRNARFHETPQAIVPKTDALMTIERTFVDFMNSLAPAFMEFADYTARQRCREILESVDSPTFVQMIKEAAANGDAATLSVAEHVLGSKVRGDDVAAKAAFIGARNSLQIPGLDESRAKLDAVKDAFRGVHSTEKAIVSAALGGDALDTKRMMDDFNAGELPSQKQQVTQ
jgi:hypothetical protein